MESELWQIHFSTIGIPLFSVRSVRNSLVPEPSSLSTKAFPAKSVRFMEDLPANGWVFPQIRNHLILKNIFKYHILRLYVPLNHGNIQSPSEIFRMMFIELSI